MKRTRILAVLMVVGLALGVVATAQASVEIQATLAFLSATRDGAPVQSTLVLVCPYDTEGAGPTAADLANRVADLEAKLGKNMNFSSISVISSTDVRLRMGEEQAIPTPAGGDPIYITLDGIKSGSAILKFRQGTPGVVGSSGMAMSAPMGGQALFVQNSAAGGGAVVMGVKGYSSGAASGGTSGGTGSSIAYGTTSREGATVGSSSSITLGAGQQGGAGSKSMNVSQTFTGQDSSKVGVSVWMFASKDSGIATQAKVLEYARPDVSKLTEADLTGKVVIEGKIDIDGALVGEHVVEGSGPLVDAALATARKLKFAPARDKFGEPIEAPVTITVGRNLSHPMAGLIK